MFAALWFCYKVAVCSIYVPCVQDLSQNSRVVPWATYLHTHKISWKSVSVFRVMSRLENWPGSKILINKFILGSYSRYMPNFFQNQFKTFSVIICSIGNRHAYTVCYHNRNALKCVFIILERYQVRLVTVQHITCRDRARWIHLTAVIKIFFIIE